MKGRGAGFAEDLGRERKKTVFNEAVGELFPKEISEERESLCKKPSGPGSQRKPLGGNYEKKPLFRK